MVVFKYFVLVVCQDCNNFYNTSMQDQGFCDDQPEYVEIKNIPTLFTPLSPTSYKPKLYTNSLKMPNSSIHNPQLFIDSSLKKQLKDKFKQYRNSNIIYEQGQGNISGRRVVDLQFDSNYPNANLEYVISEDMVHFDLYIKADTNTRAHFQWFCFKVRNRVQKKVTFRIKNFIKGKMLYRNGLLRPFYRSQIRTDQQYHQINNQCTFRKNEQEDDFFELSFDFQLETAGDQVEICSQPPYSHKRMEKVFRNMAFNRVTISRTVLGHNIDAFMINQNKYYKAVAVIFARQHPGETVGSWMAEGLAHKLMELSTPQILWIIVPMINVDGVIVGNNRTGVLGYDFNRHWYIDKETNRSYLFPELIGIIKYFKRRQKDFGRKVKLFLDLHGHSSNQNVFAYGPPHHKTSEYYQLSRLFPYMMGQKNTHFSYKQSSFQLTPAKKHCARAVFFERLGYQFSYTIQSSFGIYGGKRINEIDMMKVGEGLCETVADFLKVMVFGSGKGKAHQTMNALLMKLGRQIGGQGVTCDDSDSEEEDGNNSGRKIFQHKVLGLLGADKQKERADLCKESGRRSFHQPRRWQKYINGDSKPLPHPKASGVKFRLKTQNTTIDHQRPEENESSLILPPLNQRKRYPTESGAVLDLSFNNLSLSEIKTKLQRIRFSKLGKKILINPGY